MSVNRNLTDGINLVSKLTWKRFWNVSKVVGSYYVSRFTGRPVHWGMPVSLSFEPTTSCNLRCPECPSGLRAFTRPTGMLDPAFFRQRIDELAKELMYLVFYFQGEPYLNPHFLELVRHASERGIYTATSTNAHYLDDANARATVESGLDRLIVSIDGTTQEVYQQYRIGGSLDRVLDGTRNVIHWKKKLGSRTPYVVFQFLVVRPNEHQVGRVKELASELGVDAVAFKTAQVYDYENGNALIPDNPAYSRYIRGKDGAYRLRNGLLNHCWKLWHSCVITWDGTVVPCCFDKDARHRMGDLRTTPFRDVWNNATYRAFRANVLKSRSTIDMCTNCTEGGRIWAEA